LVLLAVLASACSAHGQAGGIDEGAYTRANHSLFHQLPTYPDAVFVSRSERAYQRGDREDAAAPIAGVVTVYVLRLPARAAVRRVARFYEHGLSRAGWQLDERLPGLKGHAGPVLNYHRRTALVSINLEGGFGHKLEIDLDHAGA
jgi:hypothetical protein